MDDQERTAQSFYTNSQWLPALPDFRDPFMKVGDQVSIDIISRSNSPSPATPPPPPPTTANRHLPQLQRQTPPTPQSYAASTVSSTSQSTNTTPQITPSSSCSSTNNVWKPYNGSINPSTNVSPSLGPSPLSSKRNSFMEENPDPDLIEVASPHSHHPRRQSAPTLNANNNNNSTPRLCLQLKREHIIYDEVAKGQLPEISIMKDKLNKLLPPFQSDYLDHNEMSIRVLSSTPHYIIKGTIILESRKASWRKHSKVKSIDVEAQNRSLPELSAIDPWELPIDGSSLLESESISKGLVGKKTFEFPQYRIDAECKKCEGGKVDCSRCGGLESVDCFWCASTGFVKGKKCKKCNTTGRITCVKCKNTGKLDCKSCDGMGAFKWALCVDLTMDSLSLPAITLEDLILPAEEGVMSSSNIREAGFVRLKATQAIYETAQSIFDSNSAAKQGSSSSSKRVFERRVPVLAQCHVEVHMKRLLHVSRWNHLQPRKVDDTRFLFLTSDDGEDNQQQLTQLPFTMNEAERARIQHLDAREHQRRLAEGSGRHSNPPLPPHLLPSPHIVMRSVPQSHPSFRKSSLPMASSAQPVLVGQTGAQRGSM